MDQGIETLTARDQAILEFEQSWWLTELPKDQAVRERFQLTEAEYSAVLEELVSSDVALAEHPLLVRRLRRLRDRRRRQHDARRSATQEVAR